MAASAPAPWRSWEVKPMAEYAKPLPQPTEESQMFWDGCKRHELLIQRCKQCGTSIHYPRTACPVDYSGEFDWLTASGKGHVHSYIVSYRAFHPGFADDLPYIAAIIELEQGVRMISNVVGIAPEEIAVDMPVEVIFEEATPEFVLPKFRPANRP